MNHFCKHFNKQRLKPSLEIGFGCSKEPSNPLCSGPEVIELFFMLNSTEREISTAYKNLNANKCRQMKTLLALSLSDVVFIMLINVKMPTHVGI